MMKRAIAAALVVGLIAGSAYACSCIAPGPPKESLEKAHAVFSGKVTKIEKVGDFQIAVTLDVEAAWKGIDKNEVVLYTANDGAACGYGFEKEKTYLIYAYQTKRGEEKQLETNICTRTRLLAEAKEDLKELGEGKRVK
jgi:hypothetical protein